MRSNERMIFVGVAVVALALAFYLLVLSPKRDKASELSDQVNQLNASIAAAQQQTSYGEQARQDFPKYYGRMVVLGKAVPAQSDTASLLVQLNSLSDKSKVDLQAIALNAGGGSSSTSSSTPTPPATPAAPATPNTQSSPTAAAQTAATTASTANSATPTSTSPAPATEASAANLPIGAVVGPAGLPTLPYDLTLKGSYFNVSNFIGNIDGLVKPVAGGAQLSPDGRLLTVNGFSLALNGSGPSPRLKADFVVTAYSTGDQGLTLGATSSGPAPTSPSPGETQVQPASAVVAK